VLRGKLIVPARGSVCQRGGHAHPVFTTCCGRKRYELAKAAGVHCLVYSKVSRRLTAAAGLS
jgi:hypothetical protein